MQNILDNINEARGLIQFCIDKSPDDNTTELMNDVLSSIHSLDIYLRKYYEKECLKGKQSK